MNTAVIIGVDIGGTKMRIGMVDTLANLSDEKIYDSRGLQGEEAVEALLGYIQQYIDSIERPVRAVSIGFPSTIDKDRTTVINTPNLIGFNAVPIRQLYEKELGIPVFLNNDASMLLHYDMHNLKIDPTGIIVGIYIGTGIGNSVIIDGKELTGRDGVACELGHVPVPGRNDLCSCGLRGCLEMYAGGKGLERFCAADFPETPIKEVFLRHGNTPQIQQFIDEVADAVVIEINIFNPNFIVLGGGVLQMEAFPKELLLQRIMEKTRKPVPGDTMKIAYSDSVNPYNGVVGSALYAMKKLDKETQQYDRIG